ncbi:hypothetical protein LCGC14_0368310 [marine sediment metagenome]|uniref:Uncharacterized protein n=1 Tax=marine sediment metagenome TaxID=412755 RepID=A0A0F9TBU6_9ZZZZ
MVKAERIKKVKIHYEVEFENGDEPSFKREAGHEIGFEEGMKPSKRVIMDAIRSLNKGFEDFFNGNIEDNS